MATAVDLLALLVTCALTFMCIIISSEAKVYQINVCDNNDEEQDSNTIIDTLNTTTEFELPFELRPAGYFNPSFALSFQATKHKLKCPESSFTVTWIKGLENITNAEGSRIKMPDLIISPNKYIKYKNQVYQENQYCLSSHNETFVQFEVCNFSCSEKATCVYKCCEPDEVIDISKFPGSTKCKRSRKDRWKPVLFYDEKGPLSSANSQNFNPVILNVRSRNSFEGIDGCQDVEILLLQNIGTFKRSIFRMLQNGSIVGLYEMLDGNKKWKILSNERYCVDGSHNFSIHRNYTSGYEEMNTILIRCIIEDPELIDLDKKKQTVDFIYGIVLVICSFFLLLTLIVYLILWKTHNVHILTQLCYIFSLFCAYIFLAATRFTSVLWTRTNVVSNPCRIIGIFAHFFYLSTFTWLSIVNLDIWLTFRNLKPITISGKKGGLKKLVIYSIFAEGVPLAIVGVAVILDSIYEDDIANTIVLPQYGQKNCFLDMHFAQLYYLYIPIGVLLSVNIIFFTLTIYSLYDIQESTKFATTSSSKSNKQNESLKLFTKIFLIMGIPWVFDVISWLSTTDSYNTQWHWVIADILLFCQSFAFFSFFVMKKEICHSLETKYPAFKKLKEQVGGLLLNAARPFPTPTKCWCLCLATKDNLSEANTVLTDNNTNSKNYASVQETNL